VGDTIPVGARVVSAVDAFDAITTNQPYRMAMVEAEAIERLRGASGTQFDPLLVAQPAGLVERGLYRAPLASPAPAAV